MKLKYLTLFLSFFLLFACGKEDDPESKISIDFTYRTMNDRVILDASKSSSEVSKNLKFQWKSTDPDIYINRSNEIQSYFTFPDRNTSSEVEINLIIDDGHSNKKLQKSINISAFNDHIIEWGLGTHSINRLSNDVDYEWYIDQATTGKYNYENCGPSCVNMALKWVNKDWNKTAEDARAKYHPDGGWWYTSDIIEYLLNNGASVSTIHFDSYKDLVYHLNKGDIAILCLDMHHVSSEQNQDHRIDKYYQTSPDWGHFIIVKGYRYTDTRNYFEAYDPNSWGARYSDNSYKGVNRYYRTDDISRASNNWWKYAIIVHKTPLGTKTGIDPRTIEHAWGR